jgi:hypothetical protein
LALAWVLVHTSRIINMSSNSSIISSKQTFLELVALL